MTNISTTSATRPGSANPVALVTAQAGIALFLLLVVLLHGLRTDYSPIDDPLSAYAIGDHGWLMEVAFLANAVAFVTLGVAAWSFSRATSVLLAIAGIGMAVAAAFRTDYPVVTPPSPVGAVHSASALISFVGLTVAAIVALRALRHTGSRATRTVATALAIAAVPAFVVFLALTFTDSAGAGLAQRILTVLLLGSMLTLTTRLRRAEGLT